MNFSVSIKASQSVFYSCLEWIYVRLPTTNWEHMIWIAIMSWYTHGGLSVLTLINSLASSLAQQPMLSRSNQGCEPREKKMLLICNLKNGFIHFKQKQQLNWNFHYYDIPFHDQLHISLPAHFQCFFSYFSHLKIQLLPRYLGLYVEGTSQYKCNQELGRERSGLILSRNTQLLAGGGLAMRPNIDREVRVGAPLGDIVLCSWTKHFTLRVPLSTQVYK